MPAGVGVWDKAVSGQREVRRGRSVSSIGDEGEEEGRLQQVVCCRDWRIAFRGAEGEAKIYN